MKAAGDQDKWVGVISDTHGQLRPEAIRALEGAEQIIHAGDVGSPEVLEALGKIAPVTAVRGNVDKDVRLQILPETAAVEIGVYAAWVLHDIHQLDLDPVSAGFAVVISGHSHKPSEEIRNGVLYLNPGAAGPKRFKLPVTLARLYISGPPLRVEFVALL